MRKDQFTRRADRLKQEAGTTTPEPGTTAPDGKLDLHGSLQSLFRAAEREGDYAGAATVARILRDLDKSDDTTGSDRYPYQIFVDRMKRLMSQKERDEFFALQEEMRALHDRRASIPVKVALRSGIPVVWNPHAGAVNSKAERDRILALASAEVAAEDAARASAPVVEMREGV